MGEWRDAARKKRGKLNNRDVLAKAIDWPSQFLNIYCYLIFCLKEGDEWIKLFRLMVLMLEFNRSSSFDAYLGQRLRKPLTINDSLQIQTDTDTHSGFHNHLNAQGRAMKLKDFTNRATTRAH